MLESGVCSVSFTLQLYLKSAVLSARTNNANPISMFIRSIVHHMSTIFMATIMALGQGIGMEVYPGKPSGESNQSATFLNPV